MVPTFAKQVSSPATYLTVCPATSFTCVSFVAEFHDPSLDRGRAMGREIEFADQGTTVKHQYPVTDALQLHSFSTQSLADVPSGAPGMELAPAVYFSDLRARRILPSWGPRIVTPWTLLPATGWGLHS